MRFKISGLQAWLTAVIVVLIILGMLFVVLNVLLVLLPIIIILIIIGAVLSWLQRQKKPKREQAREYIDVEYREKR